MVPSPLRRIPMMARSVVVLPAPLRPSSVTVSPWCTSRSTPCRTWLSPYQPCRPRTSRRGSVRSLMLGSHIGLAHTRIGADRLIGPLGEDLAPREHRDPVAEIGDDVEVVFDHEHRAVPRDTADELDDAADILMAHAGHGLVEEEKGRLERQRRGNLERTLAPIRELDG